MRRQWSWLKPRSSIGRRHCRQHPSRGTATSPRHSSRDACRGCRKYRCLAASTRCSRGETAPRGKPHLAALIAGRPDGPYPPDSRHFSLCAERKAPAIPRSRERSHVQERLRAGWFDRWSVGENARAGSREGTRRSSRRESGNRGRWPPRPCGGHLPRRPRTVIETPGEGSKTREARSSDRTAPTRADRRAAGRGGGSPPPRPLTFPRDA